MRLAAVRGIGLLLLVVGSGGVLARPALGARQDLPPTRPAVAPSLEARIEGFRSDLSELRKRLGIPGLSVAVARDGELLWAEGMGLADVAAGRPAEPGTPYRIASITKTMTAAVVVGLAHEGKLDLDAPVAGVLREDRARAGRRQRAALEVPAWAERVTVRHLLTHTSESDPPGTGFAYSGRYDVLARVAEAASGRSFSELLVERLFVPAGMARSYPVSLAGSPRADGVREDLATGYWPDGRPAAPGALPDRTAGGNGVVSTVLDLVRWAHAVGEGTVVAPEVRDAMWTRTVTPGGETGDTLSYGLGWWVEETSALELVYHGGQWPVYSGLLLHVRGPDLTLAILANHRGVSWPFYGIGTGTSLYPTFAASFLRRFALDAVWEGEPPELPWDVSADSLAAVVEEVAAAVGEDAADERLRKAARHHLGAELLGRGLLARAEGDTARADSLLRAAVECCPSALAASDDLGILFHLGKSGDPRLLELGQEAGRRRLERYPGDPVTRFHLAIAHLRAGVGPEAERLLRGLVDREGDVPDWMWSWSAYLLAEALADERPAEARRLLERVLEEGEDEGGLFGQVRKLLEELSHEPQPDGEPNSSPVSGSEPAGGERAAPAEVPPSGADRSDGEGAGAGYLDGAGGARLHFRVLGSAPDTVVVVHGGPGAGINSVLPDFAPLAEWFTLVFYDQRGGGRSELPADTSLLQARWFVEDLEAVRRHFGLERMKLLAHSFGSILVARYARTYPERVERVVLHGATGPQREAAARIARARSPLAGPDSALSSRAAVLLRSLLEGTAVDPVETCEAYEEASRRLAEARGEPSRWRGTTCAAPPEAVRYYYRHTAQHAPRTFGDWDFTSGLEALSAPVLVVHGARDTSALAPQRAWAAAVPNGRLLLVPGAEKGAVADRPEVVLPAVAEFLEGGWPAAATRVDG